jgi:hypothetical protein
VPRRQHEAVSVRPLRVRRVVAQETGEQCVSEGGQAHWRARMPGSGFFHPLHGKNSNGVDGVSLEISCLQRHGVPPVRQPRTWGLNPSSLVFRSHPRAGTPVNPKGLNLMGIKPPGPLN